MTENVEENKVDSVIIANMPLQLNQLIQLTKLNGMWDVNKIGFKNA